MINPSTHIFFVQRQLKLLSCMLVCGFLSNPLWAQSAQLQSRTDVQEIMIGDPVRLFFNLQYNTGTHSVQWPQLPDTFNHLEIVDRSAIDTQTTQETVTLQQTVTITGFDSGAYEIPRFIFLVTDKKNGKLDTLISEEKLIQIQIPQVDTSLPFKGIKDIVTVPTSWTDYLPVAGWVILGAALLAMLWWWRKKRKKKTIQSPSVSKEKYWERSERLLRELEAKKLWEQGQVKEYYTQLTDILREYLEHRFTINAKEQTTAEINAMARKLPEMRAYRKTIRDILVTADLAKFAKAQPLPDELEAAMQSVKDFVVITRPQVENTEKIS